MCREHSAACACGCRLLHRQQLLLATTRRGGQTGRKADRKVAVSVGCSGADARCSRRPAGKSVRLCRGGIDVSATMSRFLSLCLYLSLFACGKRGVKR